MSESSRKRFMCRCRCGAGRGSRMTVDPEMKMPSLDAESNRTTGLDKCPSSKKKILVKAQLISVRAVHFLRPRRPQTSMLPFTINLDVEEWCARASASHFQSRFRTTLCHFAWTTRTRIWPHLDIGAGMPPTSVLLRHGSRTLAAFLLTFVIFGESS